MEPADEMNETPDSPGGVPGPLRSEDLDATLAPDIDFASLIRAVDSSGKLKRKRHGHLKQVEVGCGGPKDFILFSDYCF